MSLYRELFNRATWGGAWGGGSLVTAMEVEGYSSFSWKTHIFEATEGAHGGAQKWWGEWGGEFSHTWGAMGGRSKHL